MDIFMDKFSQKRNAQDMIRANSAAEAQENERLNAKIESYDALLEEIRKVNLQNLENAEKAREVMAESLRKLDDVRRRDPEDEKVLCMTIRQEMEEALKAQQEAMNAALAKQKAEYDQLFEEQFRLIEQSLTKEQEVLQTLLAESSSEEARAQEIEEQRSAAKELHRESNDFMHRESVKVYRNVQASMENALEKQKEEILSEVRKGFGRKNNLKILIPIGVITMVAVLANTAIEVCRIMGVL